MITNLWGNHHDARLFPDPHVFRPERFLDSDGDLLSAGEAPRKHLFPFGAGVRYSQAKSKLFYYTDIWFTEYRYYMNICIHHPTSNRLEASHVRWFPNFRVCAGETLAVTRLFVTFARLVQQFTIMPATTKQEQPSIHPETGFKFGNVLYPHDYKIRMVQRT